jgi:hypothetical protein
MERHQLVEQLAQLHAELARTENPDPETLVQLRAITADIERLLGDDTAAIADDDAEPITSGLRSMLLKFESEHPQLAVAIGKVADALAAIGI